MAEIMKHEHFAYDEYLLALKLLIHTKGLKRVSGLPGEFNENLSEAQLEELTKRALKSGVLVQKEKELHIGHDVHTFLTMHCKSRRVFIFTKPSFGEHRKIIFVGHEGLYACAILDSKTNWAEWVLAEDPEPLYAFVQKEIHEKDMDRNWQPSELKAAAAKYGWKQVFNGQPIFMMGITLVDNSSGSFAETPQIMQVSKNWVQVLTGSFRDGTMTNLPADELDNHLVDRIRKRLVSVHTNTGGNGDIALREAEAERFSEEGTRFSFGALTEQEGFPKNGGQLVGSLLKGIGRSVLKRWKFYLVRLILAALAAAGVTVWNIYYLCVKNDTFRMDRNAILGNIMPYLFGGELGGQPGMADYWANNSALLASGVYAIAMMLVSGLISTITSKRFGPAIKQAVSFPRLLPVRMRESGGRTGRFLAWAFILCAPVTIFIYNPVTAALLAVLFWASALAGDASSLGYMDMLVRSAVSYKKTVVEGKKPPKYAAGILRLFSLALAFTLYSIINLIAWKAMYFRLVPRILFMAIPVLLSVFYLITGKKNGNAGDGGQTRNEKKEAKTGKKSKGKMTRAQFAGAYRIAKVLTALTSIAFVVLAVSLVAFADDGGWTESGGTLAGLFANYGWETILAFSLVMGAAVFGACFFGIGVPIIYSLAYAGGASVLAGSWATFTDSGRETAYDFIWGKYSPYGGDSMVATVLDFAVGSVPVIGDAWGAISSARDATYDFSNGNYVMGSFEAAMSVFSLYSFGKSLDDYVINPQKGGLAYETGMNSNYDDRIAKCPSDDGVKGQWTNGTRGDGHYVLKENSPELQKILDEKGLDGVDYVNGQADFSPFSRGTVDIDDMSIERLGKGGNYDQASQALAKQKGCTASEVKKWMKDNKYTWHETNNMSTMLKVPTVVNSSYKHLGGVGEIGKAAGKTTKSVFSNKTLKKATEKELMEQGARDAARVAGQKGSTYVNGSEDSPLDP